MPLEATGILILMGILFFFSLIMDRVNPHRYVKENRELKSKIKEYEVTISKLQKQIGMLNSTINRMKPVYDKHKPKPKPKPQPQGKTYKLFNKSITVK